MRRPEPSAILLLDSSQLYNIMLDVKSARIRTVQHGLAAIIAEVE